MVELKPCPFCGSAVRPKKVGNFQWKIEGDHEADCVIANMGWWFFYDNEEQAAEAWNRRVS